VLDGYGAGSHLLGSWALDSEGIGIVRTTTATWSPTGGWSIDLSTVEAEPGASVAVAFGDPEVEISAALAEFRAAVPDAALLACSTAGQILGQRVDPAPLVLALCTFSSARVVSGFVHEDGSGSRAMGTRLAAELLSSADQERIAGVMIFGGGLETNGSALVEGLMEVLPPGTPISGGLAGDGPRFEKTWVHCNGESGQDCVAGFAVLGRSVRFRHGSEGGWDGFGPLRTITRSENNVLYELDGQPALGLYKQYLGDRAKDLPGSALLFPLTVISPDGHTSVVRTILSVDEQTQSMTFAGDVPQGWRSRLMWTTVESLMEGASDAAEDASQQRIGLAVAVSCVGRRLVLGHRTDEEVECVVDVIGQDTPLIGFYSYGEISPVDGWCQLHNQTMTITTLTETVA
jgi:hypothetical protein